MERKTIFIVCSFLCVVALLPIPVYGFYTVLRIVVTIGAVVGALMLKAKSRDLWIYFAGLAVLFNPIIPVHLTKEIWAIIDLVAAGSFLWMATKND